MGNTTNFLRNALIEPQGGGLYCLVDYDNEEDYIYVDTSGREYEVKDTNLDLTPAEEQVALDKVHNHIVENLDDDSDSEIENVGIFNENY